MLTFVFIVALEVRRVTMPCLLLQTVDIQASSKRCCCTFCVFQVTGAGLKMDKTPWRSDILTFRSSGFLCHVVSLWISAEQMCRTNPRSPSSLFVYFQKMYLAICLQFPTSYSYFSFFFVFCFSCQNSALMEPSWWFQRHNEKLALSLASSHQVTVAFVTS